MAGGVLLNQIEAARYLGKSVRKVRDWTRAGTIPVYYDPESSRPMYPRPALDAWMAELGTEFAKKAS